MALLDDITLIRQFVKNEVKLASNQNLRIEPAFEAVQLLSKKEGLIATLQTLEKTQAALIRKNCEQWNLLHRVLQENSFFPITQSGQQEFIQYEQHPIPAGYQVNYTEARGLWKEWWGHRRQYPNHAIQLDILVFIRQRWYPVRDIICSQGTLFIKTLVSDTAMDGSDSLVWLSRTTQHPSAPRPNPVPAEQNSHTSYLQRKYPTRSIASRAPEILNSSPSLDQPASPAVPNSAAHKAPPPQINHPGVPGRLDPQLEELRRQRVQAGTMPPASTPPKTDLSAVVRFHEGRLHVKTALGEVVVEGANLRFWLNQRA